MSLFATAVEKSSGATKSPKAKATVWVIGDSEENKGISDAIKLLVKCSAEEKALKAKATLAKTKVLRAAKANYITDFCNSGVQPEGPFKIQNAEGDCVALIVQDRSGQYAVKDEQVAIMTQLVGEDHIEDMLYEETSIGFNRDVLAIPGVSEAVEKALTAAIKKLVKTDVLTEAQSGELIVASQKRSFVPGTMKNAANLCGKSTSKLAQFLDALGSACCRYIKI